MNAEDAGPAKRKHTNEFFPGNASTKQHSYLFLVVLISLYTASALAMINKIARGLPVLTIEVIAQLNPKL